MSKTLFLVCGVLIGIGLGAFALPYFETSATTTVLEQSDVRQCKLSEAGFVCYEASEKAWVDRQ